LTSYKIALIPGDGIGPEVVDAGKDALEAAAEAGNFNIEWTEFDFGAEHYLKTGSVPGEDDLCDLERFDSIYFGAIGDPRVKPGILENGILLAIRFYFDQFVNLRPVKLFPNMPCPLKNKTPEDIDFDVVRENTEDFYVGIGGKAAGSSKNLLEIKRNLFNVKFNLDIDVDRDEIAYQIGVISRSGTERVIRYAYDLAKKKGKNLVTGVDKANVLTHIYGLWRDVFTMVSRDYPGIEGEFAFVDAITMDFVRRPERYQVVVTPNMFGDIITDLGAMIQGGMGCALSGNINPTGISMFEPVHGSAPDIAGRGIANPFAQVLAGALMLETLGESRGAALVERAVEEILVENKIKTPDLGGTSKTGEVGKAIAEMIKSYGG